MSLDLAVLAPIAHFTPSELPGSLAIFVAGVGAGMALVRREWRAAFAPLTVMAGLAGLGMLADSAGWPGGLRIAIDVGFLLAGLLVVRALWWRYPMSLS